MDQGGRPGVAVGSDNDDVSLWSDLADAIHGIACDWQRHFVLSCGNDGKVRNASVLRNWFLKHTDLNAYLLEDNYLESARTGQGGNQSADECGGDNDRLKPAFVDMTGKLKASFEGRKEKISPDVGALHINNDIFLDGSENNDLIDSITKFTKGNIFNSITRVPPPVVLIVRPTGERDIERVIDILEKISEERSIWSAPVRRMTGIIWIFDHDETFGMDASSQLHRFAIEELCDRHHLIFQQSVLLRRSPSAQSTVTVMLSAAPPKLEGAKGVSAVGEPAADQSGAAFRPPLPDLKGYLEKPPTESFKLEPGEPLFVVSGPARHFYLVQEGVIDVLQGHPDKNKAIWRSEDVFVSESKKVGQGIDGKDADTSLAPVKRLSDQSTEKMKVIIYNQNGYDRPVRLKVEGGVRLEISSLPIRRGGASMTQERSGKYQARMIIRAASPQ